MNALTLTTKCPAALQSLVKSHVKQYTRVSKKTGKMATVRQHDDSRVPLADKYAPMLKQFIAQHDLAVKSRDATKGQCESIARDLLTFLRANKVGARLLGATGMKRDLPKDAHPEWRAFIGDDPTNKRFLWHVVVQTADAIIDLSGAQYGKAFAGVRVMRPGQFAKEWQSFRTHPHESGDFKSAPVKLAKAHVKASQRHTKTGKVETVRAHEDARVKHPRPEEAQKVKKDLGKVAKSNNQKSKIADTLGRKLATQIPDDVLAAAARLLIGAVSKTPAAIYLREKKPGEAVASYVLSQWANTSGDHNTQAIAVQVAASQALRGMMKSPQMGHFLKDQLAEATELAAHKVGKEHTVGQVLGAAIKAMYDDTQALFRKKNIKFVTAYRGFGLSKESRAVSSSVHLQPLSSFSLDADLAAEFAFKQSVPRLIGVRIPIERVVSTYLTGAGCSDEYELILAGGRCEAAMVAPTFDTGRSTFSFTEQLKKKIAAAAKMAKAVAPAGDALYLDAEISNADWIKAVHRKRGGSCGKTVDADLSAGEPSDEPLAKAHVKASQRHTERGIVPVVAHERMPGTRHRVTRSELQSRMVIAQQGAPDSSDFDARRLAVLSHPHVHAVWQKYQQALHPGHTPYSLTYKDRKWVLAQDHKDPKMAALSRREFPHEEPHHAWHAVWRTAPGTGVAVDLHNAALAGRKNYEDDLFTYAHRHGLHYVESTDMPEGIKVGQQYERPSGEIVEVDGAEDGQLLGHVVGTKKKTGLSVEAIRSGRVRLKADNDHSAELARIAAGTKRIGDTLEASPPTIPPAVDPFLDAMTPMARAKAVAALGATVTSGGRLMMRRALVDEMVADGATVVSHPKDRRRLQRQDGRFIEEKRLTSTAMDYAAHLVARK